MYKPDEDIDRLSRDAAEHYNAPGKPSWDALQQILDKELPQKKEKKRRGFFFFFWLLLGLSVAGTGIWYGVTINNKTPKTTLTRKTALESNKEKATVAEQPKAANTTSSKDKTTEAGGATASNKASTKTETPVEDPKTTVVAIVPEKGKRANSITEKKIKDNTAENKTATDVPATDVTKGAINVKDSKNKPAVIALGSGKSLLAGKKIKGNTTSVNGEEIVAANKQQSANTKPTRIKVGNQNLSATNPDNNSTTKKNKHVTKKGATNNSTPPDAAANEILTGIAANNNNSGTKNDTDIPAKINDQNQAVTSTPDTADNKTTNEKPVAKAPIPVVAGKKDSAIVAKAKKKTTSKHDRAINIGLVAGVDESTVKLTHGENAGYNIGLMGGYQFSKHWAVYTGAIYTKKNYKLDGKDFHPPAHYWTQYVDLQMVDGYCKMWEIPLQVRYTFNPGAKTAFFAGTGLSSYFMTRQYYDYSYKNNMGWPMTGTWGTDSTFKHVFSILNLSVGFEKSIGRHMNLQVEPYAKVPLGGGVGFGDIRLSSFGINFSIQYRHQLKR